MTKILLYFGGGAIVSISGTATQQAGHRSWHALQLCMSKKIAQLTKVIFHLNTKDEDHDTDLQEIADTYETEIEQMLKDSAEKINRFKSQLEAVRDDTRFQEALGQVQLRYEQERQACLSDFETFKQKMADREAAMQQAADHKIAGSTAKVQSLHTRLDDTITEIARLREQSRNQRQHLEDALAKVQYCPARSICKA
jgi:chromosome segregation ATPase